MKISTKGRYALRLMIDLARKGKALLMVSSELPELLGMCDRIYGLSEGKMAGELTAEEATQDRIMQCIMDVNK